MSGVELTPREAEVLSAIERRLTNTEIAESFYLSVRTVESHVASLRRKLGAASRAQLVEAALERRRGLVDAPSGRLRGRAAEYSDLVELVERYDVVAITGAPGAGKSRLARELLHLTQRSPVLVSLDGARPAELVGRLADALHVLIGRDNDVVNSCAVALAVRAHLVVFDDADGAVEEVHALARAIVARAPGTRVVVTTVAPPVDVAGELRIGGLGVRDDGVALFRDRARTPSSVEDTPTIARICELVDDLPLGIVLAAAAASTLPLDTIEERLRGDLGVLERRSGSRHGSLGAAIERSMDGLDGSDREGLLALVAGPPRFALPAADVLVGQDSAGLIARLVDASFVVAAGGSPDGALYRVPSAVRTHLRGVTGSQSIAVIRERGFASWRDRLRQAALSARRDDRAETGARARWIASNVASLLPLVTLDARERGHVAGELAICIEQYGPVAETLAVLVEVTTRDLLNSADVEDLHAIALALCFRDLREVRPIVDVALERFGATHPHPHHLDALLAAYAGDGARVASAVAAARRLPSAGRWLDAHLSHAEGLGWFGHPMDLDRALESLQLAMELFAEEGDILHVDNVRFSMAASIALNGIEHPRAAAWAHECVRYAVVQEKVVERALAELLELALSVPAGQREVHPVQLDVLREHGATRCLTRSYKLLAWGDRTSAGIELLEDAVRTAYEAGDRGGFVLALRDLVPALAESGDWDGAAVAFGELEAVIGEERALGMLDDEVRQAVEARSTLVAEGIGRANAVLA